MRAGAGLLREPAAHVEHAQWLGEFEDAEGEPVGDDELAAALRGLGDGHL
ncbi:MAG: hypothetical protein H0V05_03045 [Euzebyaceae bacterium]|nr:hypothetical protein [Euzebyaceae bacterium]